MKGNSAVPGDSMTSKTTWSNTSGCSNTSAPFRGSAVRSDQQGVQKGLRTRKDETVPDAFDWPETVPDAFDWPLSLTGLSKERDASSISLGIGTSICNQSVVRAMKHLSLPLGARNCCRAMTRSHSGSTSCATLTRPRRGSCGIISSPGSMSWAGRNSRRKRAGSTTRRTRPRARSRAFARGLPRGDFRTWEVAATCGTCWS